MFLLFYLTLFISCAHAEVINEYFSETASPHDRRTLNGTTWCSNFIAECQSAFIREDLITVATQCDGVSYRGQCDIYYDQKDKFQPKMARRVPASPNDIDVTFLAMGSHGQDWTCYNFRTRCLEIAKEHSYQLKKNACWPGPAILKSACILTKLSDLDADMDFVLS